MRIAVYAGSFDPVTAGHVSVVERALLVFDRVIVLLAINPKKTPMFTPAERLDMLREATSHLASVECASTEGYVVDHARASGARFLVRGVRGATDADQETALADANLELAPEIATIFIPAHPTLSRVSSSLLKQLAARGEDITPFCPPSVERRLHARTAELASTYSSTHIRCQAPE
jgi:pantetheine-phosphate adenylyltransferase